MDENPEAVNEPVVADTTPTESAPVKTTSSEVAEDEFDGLGDVDLTNPTDVKEETESKDTEASTKEPDVKPTEESTEAQPLSKAEDRKQQLNQEIRDLVSKRNTIREEVERQNAEVYQPATDEELLGQINPETGEYYNRLEAKLAAMEQRQEIATYNNQVAEAQLTLSSEASRALQDFPMFDEQSPEYDAESAKEADDLLGASLIFDPNTGRPIGSNLSPYKLYQSIANSSQRSRVRAQSAAQKATEKMMANADSAPGVASVSTGNAMDDLFNKVKDVKFSS